MQHPSQPFRLLIPMAVLILILGMVAACGGDDPTPTPVPAVEEPAPVEEEPAEEPVAEEPAEEEPVDEEPVEEEAVAEEEPADEEELVETPEPAEEPEETAEPEEEPVATAEPEEEPAATPEPEEEPVDEEDEPAAEADEGAINEISYTVVDYEFDGPDSMPAGWTRIELVNEGENAYHAQWLRFLDDRTMDDLMEAMQEDAEHFPEWLAFAGGPSAVMPGQSVSAIVNLQPGEHFITTFIPDVEGVPGIERGMIFPVTVTETDAAPAAEPEADFTIGMDDFSFDIPDTLEAGAYTFQAVNNGNEAHEAVLIQLAPDATVEDFLIAMGPDAPPGPPPGMFLGGLQVIDAGEHGYFEADLEPGDYAIICFHLEPQSGLPHFALGMVAEFTVE